MAIIQKIRKKFIDNEYEFTIPHFFEEMVEDNITFSDIEKIITKGKINKKFNRDPRGIRYEVVGITNDGRAIAVLCRIKSTGKLLFITTYAIE